MASASIRMALLAPFCRPPVRPAVAVRRPVGNVIKPLPASLPPLNNVNKNLCGETPMDGFNLRHLVLAVALSSGMGSAFAATSNDFVDNAAAGGISEIETSRLALEKSQSADIKAFANMMITDHSKANDELAAIAKKNDIKVPDSTTLTNQAKEKILDMRDQSFDAAYANNQVKAHEQTIELFKKEANTVTDDKTKGAVELKGFAQKMLPGLEKHLDMAKKLQAAHPSK
jgi:putative membrane protein